MRDRPFPRCERRWLPGRLRAEIMLRQDGRCADCGTRLIMGFIVFDHRPPLAIRDANEDANDPARLAAICWTCNEQKTPRDLKEIARNCSGGCETAITCGALVDLWVARRVRI